MINRSLSKAEIRQLAVRRRDRQIDRKRVSERVSLNLNEIAAARDAIHICCYVSFRSEVETHQQISRWLDESKTVCVPFCDGNELGLFHLTSLDQLVPGMLGILEAPKALRVKPHVIEDLSVLDLVVVPGLAFTPRGERVGYGRGYYDRVLQACRYACKVGICFDCQLFDELPTSDHDAAMDYVVTESQIFDTHSNR